jgi:NAD(P)-dependent dehydrogenase (short-subunit alcohol dehydrogenase family)
MGFTANDVPNQTGRTALITGANVGIGFETAKALAVRGARVVLACRNAEKMQAAARQIRAHAPGAHVDEVVCDLADLASVRSAAALVRDRLGHLDLLVNNGGIMALPAEG